MATNIKRTVGAAAVVPVTNGGSETASGKLMVWGDKVVLMKRTAAANEAGVPAYVGGVVVNYTCLGTDVIAEGDTLYYDATNDRLTLTASTHKMAGIAAGASGDGVTTVDLLLGEFGTDA